jgi:Tfp pilus assembly protein PilN
VECVVGETGNIFQYSILQVRNKKISIVHEGSSTDPSEILKFAKKYSSPISIAINGKGVIIKKIIFSENDSLGLKDLLAQHLPAINVNDFYVQFYSNADQTGHLAICRKEQVNDLATLFKEDKSELVNIFIGPLICNSLALVTSSYNRLSTGTYRLELVNGFVGSVQSSGNTDEESLPFDDLKIHSSKLISFASGFSYFTKQTNYHSDNIELNLLPLLHIEKINTRFLLTVLIILAFLISAINSVLFFQKFEDNSTMEVELNLYESKNAQITQLLESYQKKKNLIEQAGIFDNKKMSVYADKIAASIPNEILLRELYFNPEEGETVEDSLTNFKENQLIIKGNCSKSSVVNEWINILKSQSFVKTVNLETFIYNSEGHLPNFVLKVDTR